MSGLKIVQNVRILEKNVKPVIIQELPLKHKKLIGYFYTHYMKIDVLSVQSGKITA